MAQFLLNALTLSNINRFSKFFHCKNQEKMCKRSHHTLSVSLHYLVKCQKVMVSVGVSRMGKTGIVFVEPGAKVNSEYYCQHVLSGGLLPDIRARCKNY